MPLTLPSTFQSFKAPPRRWSRWIALDFVVTGALERTQHPRSRREDSYQEIAHRIAAAGPYCGRASPHAQGTVLPIHLPVSSEIVEITVSPHR